MDFDAFNVWLLSIPESQIGFLDSLPHCPVVSSNTLIAYKPGIVCLWLDLVDLTLRPRSSLSAPWSTPHSSIVLLSFTFPFPVL